MVFFCQGEKRAGAVIDKGEIMIFYHNLSRRGGFTVLVAAFVLLGMMVFPACSKNQEENLTKPAKKAVSGKQEAAATDASQAEKTASQSQPSPAVSTSQGLSQERQQKITRIRDLQGKLKDLQQKVLDNNPGLKDQQNKLRNTINEKLQNKLAEKNIDIERIKTLQTQLQSQEVTQEEKQKLLQEFQTKAQAYNQARTEAMNDSEVQKLYKDYVEDLQKKMREVEPKAPEWIAEIENLQTSLSQASAGSSAPSAATSQ